MRWPEGLLAFTLIDRFWDRTVDIEAAHILEDAKFELYQVKADVTFLQTLRNFFVQWLGDYSPNRFRFEGDGHTIKFRIGKVDSMITTQHKPMLEVSIESFRASSRVRMIVDETCIRNAIVQVSRCLN